MGVWQRWGLCFVLVIVLSGCRLTTTSREATPIARTTGRPILTNTPTPALPQETPTPRFTPLPICADAPPSRLILQERGRVTDTNDERLNLRSSPGTDYRILKAMEPGELFFVLDGPICLEGYAWFRVAQGDLVGWVAEGDFTEYYAEPYLPG